MRVTQAQKDAFYRDFQQLCRKHPVASALASVVLVSDELLKEAKQLGLFEAVKESPRPDGTVNISVITFDASSCFDVGVGVQLLKYASDAIECSMARLTDTE